MIVEGTALAAELRRRRLGRPHLHSSLTRTSCSAWVPGAELAETPSELLMLAALSLADAVPSPMQTAPAARQLDPQPAATVPWGF
jgi:hypothetical protein